MQGNHNDRGLWKLTEMYNAPARFFSPGETMLMDGVFQGELHCGTTGGATLPFNMGQLARADPAQRARMKQFNRWQRYLRVVVRAPRARAPCVLRRCRLTNPAPRAVAQVEQTIGMIKQYKICGDTKYRGNIEMQGTNLVLCTFLTARRMRIRDKYPRGKKFLDNTGELEEWEKRRKELNELNVDPYDPDIY